jgi:excisionase family DNA binding protein
MSFNDKKVLSNTLPKKLLNRQEAAELLGVSSGTLAVWLCAKRYDLPYIKVGRLVKYDYDDVLNFIAKSRHSMEERPQIQAKTKEVRLEKPQQTNSVVINGSLL